MAKQKKKNKSKKGRGQASVNKRFVESEEARLLASLEGLSLEIEKRGFGFRPEYCQGKGRVCVATRDFEPGETILEEEAFVHGTDNFDLCCECDSDEHQLSKCPVVRSKGVVYPPYFLKNEEPITGYLSDLKGVQSVDKARAWVKCMARWGQDPNSLGPLFTLTAPPENLARCVKSVKAVRNKAPYLLPEGLSNARAAEILAILNTNCHELEGLEGAGVFTTACLLEHSCVPNLNFTTHKTSIRLTALEPIKAGERISIDYGNNYYRPTVERRDDLQKTYGFVCDCALCSGQFPDKCRAFKCPKCSSPGVSGAEVPVETAEQLTPVKKETTPTQPELSRVGGGFVCPFGTGEDEDAKWQCLICEHLLGPEEIRSCLESEAAMKNAEAESIEELDELVEKSLMQPTHHQVFWCLDEVAQSLVLPQSEIGEENAEPPDITNKIWDKIVFCLDTILPHYHHEKVIFMDRLAQTKISVGDIEGACLAYCQAYEMSVICSGKDHPSSLQIKHLSENPPQNIQELMLAYTFESIPEGLENDFIKITELDDVNIECKEEDNLTKTPDPFIQQDIGVSIPGAEKDLPTSIV